MLVRAKAQEGWWKLGKQNGEHWSRKNHAEVTGPV